jgi:membrane associated rhomboid family serine protease
LAAIFQDIFQQLSEFFGPGQSHRLFAVLAAITYFAQHAKVVRAGGDKVASV